MIENDRIYQVLLIEKKYVYLNITYFRCTFFVEIRMSSVYFYVFY